jgi:tRNA threonylcarbamoyladenosine biosynthesis protein TsaB
MHILAIESSAKAASVAVGADGKLIAQYFQNCGLTHSKTLLAMCSDMLKNLNMTLDDMDKIAVACGPGSFTGIRIGVAAAKGLAWGGDKSICGVSTLEAMAHLSDAADCIICPVMDARRAQVYNAKFICSPNGLERLCPDRAISIEELLAEAKNDKKTYFLIGDGAELCYNQFRESRLPVRLAPMANRFQSAWGVIQAAENAPLVSPDDITPNYLRLSQAERERLERMNQNK